MLNHCTDCDTQLDAPIAGKQRCPRCGRVFVAEPARRQQPAAGAGTLMPEAWDQDDAPSADTPNHNPRHQATVDLPPSDTVQGFPAGAYSNGDYSAGDYAADEVPAGNLPTDNLTTDNLPTDNLPTGG